MIRFAFPNVNPDFIGCGRYAAFPATAEVSLYSAIFNQAEVERAAEILAPHPTDQAQKIGEDKDCSDESYAGDSMGLAYLLALISRFKGVKIKTPQDIWCTGKITLTDAERPSIQAVSQKEFAAKLDAFLSGEENPEDALFIVPAANVHRDRQHVETRCQRVHAALMTLADCRKSGSQVSFTEKTVLEVGARLEDLYYLLSVLFEYGANPYKGLSAFDEQDAARFFGREDLTANITETWRKLQTLSAADQQSRRFLAIVGPSGSGKSSAARAGFLPEIKRNPLPGMEIPTVMVFTPGEQPLQSLAEQLVRRIKNGGDHQKPLREEVEATLRREDSAGLSMILREKFNAPCVILVDQFEELYAPRVGDIERNHFIRNLLNAAGESGANATVVITLRSDFLSQSWQHPALNDAIFENQIRVFPLTCQELRLAIERPARDAGYPFDPALVDQLIAETEGHEGALPLLEFALARIWEKLKAGVAPEHTLHAIGGVGGALAGEAQRIYERLPETEQHIARRAFLAMITLGEGSRDTRRPVLVSEIAARQETPEQVHAILDRFSQAGARLITLSSNRQRRQIAEVTHEALFEHWVTLKNWVDESREDLRFQDRLQQAAKTWDQQGRHAGSLWRSPNLDLLREFHDRHEQDMTSIQFDFFNASERSQQRRRRFIRGAGVALVLVTLISSITGWRAYQESIRAKLAQMNTHHRVSRTLFSAGSELESLLEGVKAGKLLQKIKSEDDLRDEVLQNLREIVYSIKEQNRFGGKDTAVFDVAFRYAPGDGGHEWLFASQNDNIGFWDIGGGRKEELEFSGHTFQVMAIAFSPDQKLLASGSLDNTIKLWDAADGQEITTLHGHEAMVYSVAFSPNGRLLASGSWDRTIKLWNVADKSLFKTLTGHTENVMEVAFSPDGRYLVSTSLDQTIKLWNVADGSEVKTLAAHTDQVLSVAFSPDGTQLASGSMDGTGKQQQIGWGKVQGARIIDSVKPRNLREPGLDEFSLWMAKLEYDISTDAYLQFLIMPAMEFSEIAPTGSEYDALPLLLKKLPLDILEPFPSGWLLVIDPVEEPDVNVENTAFGVKFDSVNVPTGWDFTLNYLYTWNDEPIYHLKPSSFDLMAETLTLFRTPQRLHVIGGTFATNLWKGTLRGEAAATFGKHFYIDTYDVFNITVKKTLLSYALEFERKLSGISWLVQVLQERILDYDEEIIYPMNDAVNTTFSLGGFKEFRNNTLDLACFISYEGHGEEFFLHPSVQYALSDAIKISAGADVFEGGDDESLIGYFDEKDRIYAELTYSF